MGNSSKETESKAIIKMEHHHYKLEEFNDLINKISILNQINKSRIFYQDLDQRDLNRFSRKYNSFIGIKRFCIPVIGAISSGKSTLMNYLLPFHHILEIGEKVTTKFICIIRHCKDANVPEVYETKIEERGEKEFNFIETGKNLLEMESSDISLTLADIIKKKNIETKEKEQTEEYQINPEKYFLIIKMKIPLFEGEYEKYGELIDFIDIPGLDEVKQINNFDDYIKPIFKNIIFPIFIFDVNTYIHDMPKKILIQYLNYYFQTLDDIYMDIDDDEDNVNNEDIYDKGFFILNKIDYLEKDSSLKDIIEDFLDKYKVLNIRKGFVKIPFKDENKDNNKYNDFIPISAKNLKNEHGYFITRIIEDLIQKARNTNYNSFKRFKTYYFNEYHKCNISNFDDISEEEETEEIKKELNLINMRLEKELDYLNNPKLTIKEFINIKKKFVGGESQRKDELSEMLQKKIKNLIDDFLDFEYDSLIEFGSKRNEELIKEIKINPSFDPIRFTEGFNEKLKIIFPEDIDRRYQRIMLMKNDYDEFIKFQNNKKIRILFIGKISTGKTSLLNSIIGNNKYILQTTIKECTQAIFIIKNSNEISMCESRLIDNKFGNYFEDIKDTIITGEEEVKQKIKKINSQQGKSNIEKYYTIKIPIEGFEKEENNEFNSIPKEDIELIDIPGFKDSNLEKQKYLKNLINLCDGFVFSFNSVNIEDQGSQEIISTIMEYIKEKNETFDFNNCLFNLNYIDKVHRNEIEKTVREFKKILQNILVKKTYTGDLIEKLKIKQNISDIDKINVSYFSNIKYQLYQQEIDNINNLKILDNIEYDNDNGIEDLLNYLEEEYEGFVINEKINENKINEKIGQIIHYKNIVRTNDNQKIIEKIGKLLISIVENKKQLPKYKISYASSFFTKVREQLNYSNENHKKIKIKKSLEYIISFLFKLYYIDHLCKNPYLINKTSSVNLRIKKINNKYNKLIKIIEKAKLKDK